MKNNNRRDFLKSMGLLGLGTSLNPSSVLVNHAEKQKEENLFAAQESESKTLTILQTTDVHCQIHPHDELFWENDKAVFRKTGGYAHLATLLSDLKNVILIPSLWIQGICFKGVH